MGGGGGGGRPPGRQGEAEMARQTVSQSPGEESWGEKAYKREGLAFPSVGQGQLMKRYDFKIR